MTASAVDSVLLLDTARWSGSLAFSLRVPGDRRRLKIRRVGEQWVIYHRLSGSRGAIWPVNGSITQAIRDAQELVATYAAQRPVGGELA